MPDQDVFLQRALLADGLIEKDQLDSALRYGREHTVDLVDAIVQLEILTSRQVALVKADVCEVPFAELSDFEVSYANTRLLPRSIAERHVAYPLFMIDGVLTVAMDDPLNLEATDQIRQVAKCDVDTVLCDREQIKALISRAYSLSHSQSTGTQEQKVETEIDDEDASQPVVAAVNQMLAEAVGSQASDIHINPDEHQLHLRYRVDGVLQEKQGPPLSMHSAIVQRLKVMAHLDLTVRPDVRRTASSASGTRQRAGRGSHVHAARPSAARTSSCVASLSAT